MSYFIIELWGHTYGIHQGDSVHLAYQPDIFGGTGPLSYLWRPNHGLIGSTHATFWAAPDTSINYYVTATDSVGCSQSGQLDYIQVIVSPEGIEEVLLNTGVKICPNPASSYIQKERMDNSPDEAFA